MFSVPVDPAADETAFRTIAKACLARRLSPHDVVFTTPDAASLLPPLPMSDTDTNIAITTPRSFSQLMHNAICHSAEDRFALLYEVFWRILNGERDLADRASDRTVSRLLDYSHAVRRDIHKMHAFLRFKEQQLDGRTVFTAWFEPHHYILKRAIPFFVDRFASMEWMIATPRGSAAWQDGTLTYGPPAPKPAETSDAVLDELWLTYYRSTFNPARVKLKMMRQEMPRYYWNNMPETALIPSMLLKAEARVTGMLDMKADQPELFAERLARRQKTQIVEEHAEGSLAAMRKQADHCTRCPLYKDATQTVFGEGPTSAPVVFVGEQPGDQEDLAGKPFVGPAGQLFDRALKEAGLDRSRAYVTNSVKHFKFEPRGKRRLHKRPNAGEIQACRFWLDGELDRIKPDLVVALGATAAQALAHRAVPVTKARGPFAFPHHKGFITVHPSFLLRVPDAESKEREYHAFLRDLKKIGELAPSIRA